MSVCPSAMCRAICHTFEFPIPAVVSRDVIIKNFNCCPGSDSIRFHVRKNKTSKFGCLNLEWHTFDYFNVREVGLCNLGPWPGKGKEKKSSIWCCFIQLLLPCQLKTCFTMFVLTSNLRDSITSTLFTLLDSSANSHFTATQVCFITNFVQCCDSKIY